MADLQLLTVRYFAALREQRGLDEEAIPFAATTPAMLYGQLRKLHRFTLDPTMVRAAVNGRLAAMDQALAPGDAVVFLPPVAGG